MQAARAHTLLAQEPPYRLIRGSSGQQFRTCERMAPTWAYALPCREHETPEENRDCRHVRRRVAPRSYYYDPPHILGRALPWIDLNGLLDLAFEQILRYPACDAALSLRLVRVLTDVRIAVIDPQIAALLVERGRKIVPGREGHVQPNDVGVSSFA